MFSRKRFSFTSLFSKYFLKQLKECFRKPVFNFFFQIRNVENTKIHLKKHYFLAKRFFFKRCFTNVFSQIVENRTFKKTRHVLSTLYDGNGHVSISAYSYFAYQQTGRLKTGRHKLVLVFNRIALNRCRCQQMALRNWWNSKIPMIFKKGLRR